MMYDKEIEIRKQRCIKTLGGEAAKRHFETLQAERHKKKDEPYNLAYNRIIDETASFIQNEFGTNDPLPIMVIYNYMLYKGYFSKDKCFEFSYDKADMIKNPVNYAADIMRGKGDHLGIASMLDDIYNNKGISKGISSCIVGCKLEPLNSYRYSYARYLRYYDSLLSKIWDSTIGKSLTLGNFAAVLIKFNNTFLVMDPSFLTYYYLPDFLFGNDICFSVSLIDIKPYSSLFLSKKSPDELLQLLLETENKECCFREPYNSSKTFYDAVDTYTDLCEKNTSSLDDFHKEITSDIHTICRTLKK